MWIKTIVEDLVDKYDTNNPFEIASAENIHVFEWNLNYEILGFYKYVRRNQFIYINSNISENEKLFTCAHELGHSQLHDKINTPFLKRNTLMSVDKIEKEANRFAVELLIPDQAIYEHANNGWLLHEVAESYGVPREVSNLKKLKDDFFYK